MQKYSFFFAKLVIIWKKSRFFLRGKAYVLMDNHSNFYGGSCGDEYFVAAGYKAFVH